MEINKIRIMARHSGDQMLCYVQDAPLRSLRAHLGLTASTSPTASALPFGPTAASPSTARMRERLRKLEAEVVRLEVALQAQAREVIGIATGLHERTPECSSERPERGGALRGG